jgi:hypothetical protein
MTNKIIKLALAITIFGMASCSEVLVEEPKSLLTAKFLETPSGVNAALSSAYSDLRYFYGGEGGMSVTCAGTDEWQKGPDGNLVINTYGSSLASEGLMGNTWNWGYTAINTTNAVIKYAEVSGMPAADAKRVLGEAKFLRAQWYFTLVQLYGALPLSLDFISEPSTEAYRDPVSDVYDAIVSDLETAKADLPATTDEPGRATAAAAYHLLSKVYLTRATSVAKKTTDYQSAYDNAMYLIDNASSFNVELLKDFKKVHEIANEHNKEILFTVERSTDELYNDLKTTYKNNQSSFYFRPNYSAIVPGLIRTIEYGRPWHRVRPTNYLLEVVFKDRIEDTRYGKTFQTVWLVNDEASCTDKSFKNGDIALWLPGTENYDSNVKALKIFKPSQYYGNVMAGGTTQTLSVFPSLTKYDDNQRPTIADASVRPHVVYRFAETYLIAAEAAMYLSKAAESRALINVIRTRGAYSADRSDGDNALAVQRVTNKTPDMTNIDEGISFILDERSRELCGEYMRWYDLARTRTVDDQCQLLYRIRNLVPEIPAKTTIQDYHVLRPIPQEQLDLTSNEFLNNPGYY